MTSELRFRLFGRTICVRFSQENNSVDLAQEIERAFRTAKLPCTFIEDASDEPEEADE